MMYTFSCHSFRHFVGGGLDCFSCTAFTRTRKHIWDRVSAWNTNHRLYAWSSLVWIAHSPTSTSGWWPAGPHDPNTWKGSARWLKSETATNTTSSSSAPAARGCARRSRRRRPGVKTALVCKSLLGKAHTVMAEGGIAAALGQRLRRGQLAGPFPRHDARRQDAEQLAHGPAPRQEAPDRVNELEEWGASSTARRTAASSSATSAATATRLAHVGDRTGLEMIRTLQHHAVHQGIDVFMECTIVRLLKDGDAISGALAYGRESGKLFAASRPWSSPPAASARRTRSRRTPGSTPATATRSRCGPAPT